MYYTKLAGLGGKRVVVFKTDSSGYSKKAEKKIAQLVRKYGANWMTDETLNVPQTALTLALARYYFARQVAKASGFPAEAWPAAQGWHGSQGAPGNAGAQGTPGETGDPDPAYLPWWGLYPKIKGKAGMWCYEAKCVGAQPRNSRDVPACVNTAYAFHPATSTTRAGCFYVAPALKGLPEEVRAPLFKYGLPAAAGIVGAKVSGSMLIGLISAMAVFVITGKSAAK